MYAVESGAPVAASALQHAAAQQERRLRGESGDLEPGALAGLGDGAEVDVRGDVAKPRPAQRVVVDPVTVVADERAHVALRMVVLAGAEAVVDEEHGAAHEDPAEFLDQRLGCGVDFARVVAGGREALARQRRQPLPAPAGPPMPACPGVRPRRRRARGTGHPGAGRGGRERHRALRWQGSRPRSPRAASTAIRRARKLRAQRLQRRALPGGEVGAQFEDRIARRQRAALAQRQQEVAREAARAGPELEDVASRARAQDRLDLRGQRGAEQRRHLRRRREVPGGAQLGRTGGVIAEPRRVQRDLHVPGERDPAVGLGNRLADGATTRALWASAVGVGQRQVGGLHCAVIGRGGAGANRVAGSLC